MADNDFNKLLEDFGKIIIAEIKANMAQYDLGNSKLADSLEYRITPEGIEILANNYFQYAEWGREAGGVPANFEEIIINWIHDRGISINGDEREFAQKVKWKTIKEGSYLHRNPSERRDFLEDVGDEELNSLAEKIGGYLIKSIKFPEPNDK